MKLWTGRISKHADQRLDDFNSSIAFDSRMLEEDIRGSMAHAAMLGACGIISQADADAIAAGLEGILADVKSGALPIDMQAEDVHTFVEQTLTARIGDAGKRLHTGRSRNDQVALDFRLHLRGETARVRAATLALIKVLTDKAAQYTDAVMPGYTHMQRAQPVTFAHHLLAYAFMFTRDVGRLDDAARRMNRSPLGCGALAGTTYPIDRAQTAAALGFDGIVQNSMDGVSDRDFAIELVSALSVLMMHLSRFCEEIILWCSWEFKFVELDDAFSTGSSIMPQKKNPDIAELVRGKTGRVYGDLTALLTLMKGLPLAYNKDMQEDKEAAFDAFDTVLACLEAFTPMVETMRVLPDNMRRAAARGFINATDCADYLTRRGVPFRDAYKITGQLVAGCVARGLTLEELPLAEYQAACPQFEADVYDAIRLETCAALRRSAGGPAKESVEAQLAELRAFLSCADKAGK